jgi:hypothetical protein
MIDESDRIFSWTPSIRASSPLQYRGWWVQYPKPSCSRCVGEPPKFLQSIFKVGDIVRLKGKPARSRQVLEVQWHCHRYEFVYIVETSAPSTFGYRDNPYWFAPQLVSESEWQELAAI